jgi:hypothetical protein
VLTDHGSCFTPAVVQVCAQLGAPYRHTKPYSPQTDGLVERCHGRVGSEVLGITIYSHRDLEQLLRGFNAAYNARRQHVLDGKTRMAVVPFPDTVSLSSTRQTQRQTTRNDQACVDSLLTELRSYAHAAAFSTAQATLPLAQ